VKRSHIVLSLCLALITCSAISAQDAQGRFEIAANLGGHTIVDPDPNAGTAGYYSIDGRYYFQPTQSIGVRYGAASYEAGGTTVWLGDIFGVYRYSWRPDKPTRIYLEGGLGAIDSYFGGDGTKFAATFAFGVKRFMGDKVSLSLETRGIVHDSSVGTVGVNELTFGLSYLF
jgi:hypothetical protein